MYIQNDDKRLHVIDKGTYAKIGKGVIHPCVQYKNKEDDERI